MLKWYKLANKGTEVERCDVYTGTGRCEVAVREWRTGSVGCLGPK